MRIAAGGSAGVGGGDEAHMAEGGKRVERERRGDATWRADKAWREGSEAGGADWEAVVGGAE